MEKPNSTNNNYQLFFQFIDQALPGGFKNIDCTNPLVMKLEELTEANKQFFFIFDLIQLKILFASKRSHVMMGIEPDALNPSIFVKSMHPEDLVWHNIVQTRFFNTGQQIFNENSGTALISTNFRLKDPSGNYINTLVQCYLFFTAVPYKTVFVLQVLTDISWFEKNKPGYHFYLGNDPYFFRYPDENLLSRGNVFSNT